MSKNRQESLRIGLDVLGGRQMVSVRVFRTMRNGGEHPVPGRGFALAPEHLGQLADALNLARQECERRGLIETVAQRE